MRKETAILFTFTSIFIYIFTVFCWTAGSAYAQTGRVTVGAERLLTEYDSLVHGKRVGIITNHSAVVRDSGKDRRDTLHIIDLIHEDPDISITALFGPEHGLRGQADAGEAVEDSEDELTGAPSTASMENMTARPWRCSMMWIY